MMQPPWVDFLTSRRSTFRPFWQQRETMTTSMRARITGTSCRLEPTSGGADRDQVPLELWPKSCGSPSAVPTIIRILKKRNLRYGPELVLVAHWQTKELVRDFGILQVSISVTVFRPVAPGGADCAWPRRHTAQCAGSDRNSHCSPLSACHCIRVLARRNWGEPEVSAHAAGPRPMPIFGQGQRWNGPLAQPPGAPARVVGGWRHWVERTQSEGVAVGRLTYETCCN